MSDVDDRGATALEVEAEVVPKALDSASAPAANEAPRPRRDPSHRYLIAGRLLNEGKAKTEGQAMRMAGFADSTARNPGANGFDALEAMRAAALAFPDDSLRSLNKLARGRIRDAIADPDTPAGVALTVAGGVMKLALDHGVDDDDDDEITPEQIAWFEVEEALRSRKLLRIGLERPEFAVKLMDRLGRWAEKRATEGARAVPAWPRRTVCTDPVETQYRRHEHGIREIGRP